MKALYIDINNAPIASTSEIEVLSIDLKKDFYYSLGESIKGRVSGVSSNIDLVEKNVESGESSKFIEDAWKTVKEVLFSENPEEDVVIALPQSYLEWLRYNNNDSYRNIYEQLYSGQRSVSVTINMEELYEDAISGTLYRKIRNYLRNNTDIEEFVFNDNCVSRKSSIVRQLKEKFEDLGFVPFEKWEGEVEKEQPQVVKEEVKEKGTEREGQEKTGERPTDIVAGHRMVDLGLSVCWADCNVGAKSPEECGGYFAWGETETKKKYSEEDYEYEWEYIGDDISGGEFDVARQKWGNEWRMPTLEEFEELFNNCVWRMERHNGRKGCRVIGPNGNSVFFPEAGSYGIDVDDRPKFFKEGITYWSSTLNEDDDYEACCAEFVSENSYCKNSFSRYWGFPIRPVIEKR